MIRLDIPYVDPDRTLTQAGYEVLKGQDRRIDTLEASDATEAANAPGSAPRYACRAWVNFNGTGTVAIRAAGNVSSITDNGVGDYTVNFATAMPDANFSAVVTSADNPGVSAPATRIISTAAGSVRVSTQNSISSALFDSATVAVAVFR